MPPVTGSFTCKAIANRGAGVGFSVCGGDVSACTFGDSEAPQVARRGRYQPYFRSSATHCNSTIESLHVLRLPFPPVLSSSIARWVDEICASARLPAFRNGLGARA